MKLAAVTGASGYVGGVIARALPMPVVGLVRAPRGERDVAWAFDMPVSETAALLRERKVTHLVHAAWDMKASRLAALEAGCVAGSARLLEAAQAAGIENLVFISTISAFEGARSAYGRAKLQVENMFLAAGGSVIRPGLVYGDGDGGMFGSLRKTVLGAKIIPMIGDGGAAQYLLHEATLGAAVRLAAERPLTEVVTLAEKEPIAFRDLLRMIALREHRTPRLVAVPWQGFYAGLWAAEAVGLKLGFRSDSVLSFVFQNPAPDFGAMQRLGIDPVKLKV